MTTSLEKAFAQAARLPEAAQEQLADQLLEDLGGESKWDDTLAQSQDLLESLAEKARRAREQGKIEAKGFDEL